MKVLVALALVGCAPGAEVSPSADAPSVVFADSVQALRGGNYSGKNVVELAGYYSPGDGGEGRFLRESATCPDNGGSMLNDAAGNCFYRVTSRYGPREWGAKGDGVADDTVAIQNWLSNKSLSHEPGAASQQERRAVGGTYVISNTIVCPDNTVVQGSGIEWVGAGSGTYDGLPPFQLVASAAWAGAANGPLLKLENYCRLSGVAVVSSSTLDSILIDGFHVLIDGHAAIVGGRNNITVTGPGNGQQQTGFQIKDSQIMQAANYNLDFGTPNTRLIGDVIGGAAVANIHFTGAELTIANDMIEESDGDGIVLDGASFVKIVGNQINHNGKASTGGYGLRIRGGSQHVAVTGNEMNKNGFGTAPGQMSAHVALQANASPLSDITFSGNVYSDFDDKTGTAHPDYVYDLVGPSASFVNVQLYESPSVQNVGVYTPNAQSILNVVAPLPGPLH